MKVIVAIGNSGLWEQFALSQTGNVQSLDQLTDVSGTDSQTVVTSMLSEANQVRNVLSSNDSFSVVIFYQQAEHFIAQSLAQGVELEDAKGLWLQNAEQILLVHKQNRRRVKLVNLEQSVASADFAERALAEFDVSLSFNQVSQHTNSFELLLACQLVRQDKTLSDLNVKLNASSLPAVETTFVSVDCNGLLRANLAVTKASEANNATIEELQQQALEKNDALAAMERDKQRVHQSFTEIQGELNLQKNNATHKINELQQDLELAELQMLSTQEEYEELAGQLESEKRKTVSIESQSQKQVSVLNSQIVDANQEIELLSLQLEQVQEELESQYIQNTDLASASKQLQEALAAAKNELAASTEALRNSDSVLLKTQSELEKLNRTINTYQKRVDGLEEQLAKLRIEKSQQLRRKELELTKLTTSHEKLLNEHTTLKHKLDQTKAELDQIHQSAFWKTAVPVRKLVKAVGNIDKKKAKLQRDIGLLLTSQYFDAQWYLETYPDIAASEINPAEHYLKFGAKEGRFPSPQFDGDWYLNRYPDVAEQQINPLIHYIKFGLSEGRSASPKMLTMQNDQRRG